MHQAELQLVDFQFLTKAALQQFDLPRAHIADSEMTHFAT